MIEQSAFNFRGLNPDIILDALTQHGLWLDSGLTALNSYENRVYQFVDEQRKRYVVKFYRPQRWSQAQLEEEHEFTLSLAQAGLSVAAPLSFDGKTLLSFNGYWFAVFPSIGGRQYETDNLFQLEDVGRLLGRVHQLGSQRCFEHRPTIGFEEYLVEPYAILAQSTLMPVALKAEILVLIDELITAVREHWRNDWQSIRLHGDCHPGNILWRDEAWFVDFDDTRNGPAIQDLWMLLNGSRNERICQLDTLLEAYNEYREFDQRELSLIEPLRAMRMVHYLSWVTRRWQDPAFPKAFPWMAEEGFWLQQKSLFSEQIKLLDEPPLQLYPTF